MIVKRIPQKSFDSILTARPRSKSRAKNSLKILDFSLDFLSHGRYTAEMKLYPIMFGCKMVAIGRRSEVKWFRRDCSASYYPLWTGEYTVQAELISGILVCLAQRRITTVYFATHISQFPETDIEDICDMKINAITELDFSSIKVYNSKGERLSRYS